MRKGIRLTKEIIESHISRVEYVRQEVNGVPSITCHIIMDNGFVVYGQKPSLAIDPANFSEELGRKYSYENTFEQLWTLEAYRSLVESSAAEKLSTSVSDIVLKKYQTNSSNYHEPVTLEFIQCVQFRAPNGKTEVFKFSERNMEEESKRAKEFIYANTPVEELLTSPYVINVCKAVHEAVRAISLIDGEVQPTWDEAPDWMKTSTIDGVIFHLSGDRSYSESHDKWVQAKVDDGWVYGSTKDVEAKRHPCIVDFRSLSPLQQAKYMAFKNIVDSFK